MSWKGCVCTLFGVWCVCKAWWFSGVLARVSVWHVCVFLDVRGCVECGCLGVCGGKLIICMYLGCVFQEVPGRDHGVWMGILCLVHGCIVWVFLCFVCPEVLCDGGRFGVIFVDG